MTDSRSLTDQVKSAQRASFVWMVIAMIWMAGGGRHAAFIACGGMYLIIGLSYASKAQRLRKEAEGTSDAG